MSGHRPNPLGRTSARLIIAIAAYRREHGSGPPWGALSRALGIPRAELYVRLRDMHRRGLVSYSSERSSLDVTGYGLSRALDAVRRLREERR